MSMIDEQLLLQDLKNGKSEAVKAWFTSYHDSLLSLVLHKLESPQDAEEIVQETFVNCLRQLNLFRGESSLWTWMQSIARHEIADFYRKKYAKKAFKTIPLADFLLQESDRAVDDVSERVQYVLSKMEKYTQEILKLKYIDGKKVSDIAILFNKSVKAIENELYRARIEFKQLWQLEYGDTSSGLL